MTYLILARSSVTAMLLCSISTAALAQDKPEPFQLDPIYVQGNGLGGDTTTLTTTSEALILPPATDGGALLSSLPGLAGSRMGGQGIDVVLRGMSKNRLNVIDAGAFTYGGCPNRMDPPSSIAAFYRADKIVVEKGYASVTNGPGAPAGTVRLEREAPVFAPGQQFTGKLATGASDNGNGRDISGSAAFNLGGGFYLQGAGEYKTADDYRDGSGQTVRSGFTQKSAGVTLGYKSDAMDVALDVEQDRAEDVKFAGASMDSPLSETGTLRLRGGWNIEAGALKRIEGTLYQSNVDHVMDNYSLRTPSGMAMVSPTTSDTHGARIEAKLEFGRTQAVFGIDHQSNNRTAFGYSAMSPAMIDFNSPASISWPDVTIAQTGLYLQTETALNDSTTLRAGLRYDHVRADAGMADMVVRGATANDYYQAVYNTRFDKARTEDNLGGLLRLEHAFDAQSRAFVGFSRTVRTADASERAMARGMMGIPSWVGNPDIAPEKHHQIDIGYKTARENWSLSATAFHDQVDDFILQTAFSSTLTGYTNVGANLSGVEVTGSYNLGKLTLAGDATYTRGQNTTDDLPLAQIPPLQGSLSAVWNEANWDLGARVNWAGRQNRIDPAIDPGKTAGWATLDLFGSYQVAENARLIGGVDNVLDKTYANHLSRRNVFDTTVERVNEPGRTFYVKLQMTF